MPVLQDHFYHKTIALLTGVFGSVFDEIKLLRSDGKLITVPIAYSVKRKYNVRNDQNPDPSTVRYKMQLPRMSFKLVGIQRDTTRIGNKMYPLVEAVDRTQVTQVKSQYNRVPFKFTYMLSVKTKNIDDMLQVLEQILVNFNPTLKVIVKDNPDLGFDSAISIKLLDSGMDDISEGSFEGEEALESNMQFELEGWLYMPTRNAKVINKVIINMFDLGNPSEVLETLVEVP